MSPRAIEVGFPIAEINRLAVPERNSFKPIYQMHKWFARRASCVFRAILLGALKPASRPDGKPTNIMEEFYKDHSQDPDTQGALVVDPFMGGGTTVVEALRLGCRVIGNDLNPVAWFIVKTEVEPVDLEELKKAYERLAQRPVDWDNGRPLAESLKSLYMTELAPGFEADVIYTFSHHQGKENVTYDLIHVCRKRKEEPGQRSWAGIRQEVRRRAREELAAIEKGRYGKQLPAADVRLVCIGKCLELFSAHYGKVLDHKGKPLSLREGLQDISTIVDQLVTPARKLPPELEAIDPLSYAWLRVLMPIRSEVSVNEVNKELRAMRVSVEDLKRAGLIIRGRTGRGQKYKVKHLERVNDLKESLQRSLKPNGHQGRLFEEGEANFTIPLVDILHLLIGLSEASEPVTEWLEKLAPLRPQIRAGLRFVRTERPDWAAAVGRVLDVMEGAPLLDRMG